MTPRTEHGGWLACLALAWLGCDDGEAQLAAYTGAQRAAVERNLAALPRIAEQVRALAPLEADLIIGTPTLVADALADGSDAATAGLTYAEDLARADELGYVWRRIDGTGALNHCASLLHDGHTAYDPALPEGPLAAASLAEVQRRYPRCAGLRYLLVIRTLEFLEPSAPVEAQEPFLPIKATLDLDADPRAPGPTPPPKPTRRGRGRGGQVKSTRAEPSRPPADLLVPVEHWNLQQEIRYVFGGGLVRGELLVFELPSAQERGGFRFHAQSSLKVEGTGEAVAADLAAQVEASLRQGLRRTLAGESVGAP